MGSLLGAQPKVVLLENTTGTAHLPGEPTLALGPCDGLVKDWAAWAGRGGWHAADKGGERGVGDLPLL